MGATDRTAAARVMRSGAARIASAPAAPVAADLPRLRPDLRWSRRVVRGEEIWVLNDPGRRTYYRFSGVVAFILKQLEAPCSREALLVAFEESFGAPLEEQDLDAVLEQAAQAELLESEERRQGPAGAVPGEVARAAQEAGGGQSLLGRLLHWRLATFDPDALLGELERRLRLLFTPVARAAWAALVAAALAVLASNLEIIAAQGARLLQWPVLLWFVPVLLGVTVLHEFGHGLACKHAGGEVRAMGFLLIYFQPALYCDISDAWMLGRRSRLWSIAGGMWVQTALWALAVLAWRVSAPGTFLNAAALAVAVAAGVGGVLNLLPFIKLDGYFFLSDWLDIPNLRPRAFAHVRCSMLGALGAGEQVSDETSCAGGRRAPEPLPPATRREARVFWIYGLSAAVLSGSLLLYLLAIVHGFVARQLGAGCVAALWLAIFALVAPPLGKVVAPLVRSWAQVLRRPRLSRASVVLLALAALMAALFLVRWELRISAEVRFEPLRRSIVRSEVEGIIETVAVREGQQVQAGDLLFAFSSRENRARLEQAEAELQKARAELALLRSGSRKEEIRNAESRFEKAVTREQYARRGHAKSLELYEQKILALRDLLGTEETLAVRQKEVEEARGQLDLVRAGRRPEEIERTRAEVARLESVVRLARENLERGTVRSPIHGRVVTPHLELKRGQRVERGEALCEVVDATRLRAEIEVPESEAAEVRIGQKVKIKARGFPGRSFWGEVISIASAAEADPDAQRASFLPAPQSRILVHTEVDNSEGLLKPEMTGNGKIYCGKRPLAELITRRLVRYVRTEFWF
ncbi:MAG: PqqD family peptide modification chaperone [Acidobacteriota bacterium]